MTARPKVSFVVPTLNRGRYVVRAVDSCLAAATAAVDVEVVVLDSMSDDGSWDLLTERFAGDPRVVLAQNKRGLGPTRSWLDGARLITGTYATFLWSDDYISPAFLDVLLPSLLEGCDLATGDGAVRDIDDDSPLPAVQDVVTMLDGDAFLGRHIGLLPGPSLPVSPAVALFSRALFDRWIAAVEAWCTIPGIRHDIMWRRAIGPDLMLFLAAGARPEQRVAVHRQIVAQFSAHAGSITVSSSSWPLRAGYWLAKWWAVQAAMERPRPTAVAASARLVVQGELLSRMARHGRTKTGVDPALVRAFDDSVAEARRSLFEAVGKRRSVSLIAGSAARLAWRMAARLIR